jgi:glutamyl-tRNA synthetase
MGQLRQITRAVRVTRLAPSPTGALHLGNARTFVLNWLLARRRGWRVVLRIEDLDGPRTKRGADRGLIKDLQWLGLDWDDGPVYQSARGGLYRRAIEKLIDARFAYACVCTRKEVESAASAPHAEDGAAVYPGTCRARYKSLTEAQAASGRPPAVRVRVPDGPAGVVAWDDGFRGRQEIDAARQLGDFVIAKADGTPAYQLAVVVDDADMGVTDVVRGDDLVESTPRQVLLYRALGLSDRIPRYTHLPLVVGADRRRLAKRHGDTRLSWYRERGVAPERILALLARWSGIQLEARSADGVGTGELLEAFQLDRLPAEPAVFTADDDRWLLEAGRSQ